MKVSVVYSRPTRFLLGDVLPKSTQIAEGDIPESILFSLPYIFLPRKGIFCFTPIEGLIISECDFAEIRVVGDHDYFGAKEKIEMRPWGVSVVF